ncbi:HIRAN domain-containing protein [Novosphingobium sp. ST904]|uniref:HIRAN domain-containing protein n=1 Tax=Novosphingobium sp. ST904 TaxID=1684385 RepID=UPI0009E87179
MSDELGAVRVVGVSYYQEALERCSAGQPVRFVHEPDNPYDETALRVVSITGETIGYLPRGSWLHRAIHQHGRGAAAIIASMGYSRACVLGAALSAVLTDDKPSVESYHANAPAPEVPAGGFRYWISTPGAASRPGAVQK